MEEEFNKKFQNLYNNISGQLTKEKETFDELERLMQKKYSQFLSKLNVKTEAKCKDQVESLFLYSDYKTQKNQENEILNKSHEQAISLPGYEKEFKEAINNLSECTSKYYSLNDDLSNATSIINNLVINSNGSCLKECQNDIKKHRHSEHEASKCIQSCLKYRNYNLQAHFKLIFDTIEEYQIMADKL